MRVLTNALLGAALLATSALPSAFAAQAGHPADKPVIVVNNTPGARVPGTDNGLPDVNPVYPFKSGKMVCGLHREPLDVKVDAAGDQSIVVTWNKKHYLLKRTPTSTGAYHFDDEKAGVVLIQIPAKSMLFDQKHMMRLADDCVPRS